MELNFLDRKDRIILTTIDIMNEFGIHSVSTKEIARREGITEAAIFKHYPKKNDLYIAVLNYFSKYDNDIYQSVKLKQLNPIDAIIYYVDLYSSYFQSYPALTAISHSLDELRYNTALDEKVKEIINTRIDFFAEYICKAQNLGYLKKDVDINILVDIFVGTLNSISFNWRRLDYSFSLKERSSQAINVLLNSFSQKSKEE